MSFAGSNGYLVRVDHIVHQIVAGDRHLQAAGRM
jgi:hypothetical protein